MIIHNKPLIMAIREAKKGQARWRRRVFGHAIEGRNGCRVGNVDAHFDEALDELEAGIDVPLPWKCYQEEPNAGLHFFFLL
jgi:hypothetical protein